MGYNEQVLTRYGDLVKKDYQSYAVEWSDSRWERFLVSVQELLDVIFLPSRGTPKDIFLRQARMAARFVICEASNATNGQTQTTWPPVVDTIVENCFCILEYVR